MNQIRDSIPALSCNEQGHKLSYDGQRVLDGMFEEHDEITLAEMRTAADWQLAQCLQFVLLNYGQEAMVPFMEAMRPTNTQEDNS